MISDKNRESIWQQMAARQRLRTLWDEGLSAGQIANVLNQEFGGALTRNAVLGAVHRIGGFTPRRASKHNAQEPWRRRMASATPKLNPKSKSKSKPKSNPPPVLRHDGGCRWPIGNNLLAQGYFCGELIQRGSYCAHHAAMAYIVPREWNGERLLHLLRR